MKSLTNISRQLSFYLRHEPEEINLYLEAEGWAHVDDLLDKWPDGSLTLEILKTIVETDTKGRYEFSAGFAKIRAVQGHSTRAVHIQFERVENPPAILYHGTASRFVESIKRDGLLPRSRQYVHMSRDYKTAVEVGYRHGTPVVLKVRTGSFNVYRSENGVYLAIAVPPECIDFPASD